MILGEMRGTRGGNLLIRASDKPVLLRDGLRLWNWGSSSSTDNKVTSGDTPASASSSQIKNK